MFLTCYQPLGEKYRGKANQVTVPCLNFLATVFFIFFSWRCCAKINTTIGSPTLRRSNLSRPSTRLPEACHLRRDLTTHRCVSLFRPVFQHFSLFKITLSWFWDDPRVYTRFWALFSEEITLPVTVACIWHIRVSHQVFPLCQRVYSDI